MMTRVKGTSTSTPRGLRPGLLGAVMIVVLAVNACSRDGHWALKDISGLMPPLRFSLTDENSKNVHARDFRGYPLVVYFGYTHCPDVCPAALNKLAAALDRLDNKATLVRVLFVSVDPARDSATVLKNYTDYFGPQFVGLRGTRDQLRRLTKRYRVTYGLGQPDEKGRYTVSHSSAMFIFDSRGRARLLAGPGDTQQALAHDLRRLITGGARGR